MENQGIKREEIGDIVKSACYDFDNNAQNQIIDTISDFFEFINA